MTAQFVTTLNKERFSCSFYPSPNRDGLGIVNKGCSDFGTPADGGAIDGEQAMIPSRNYMMDM